MGFLFWLVGQRLQVSSLAREWSIFLATLLWLWGIEELLLCGGASQSVIGLFTMMDQLMGKIVFQVPV